MSLGAVTMSILKNEPEQSSDEGSDDESHKDLDEDSADENMESPLRKRRSTSVGSRNLGKRRRLDDGVRILLLPASQL